MQHIDFLQSVFELSGTAVADIGAGNGAFACQLQERGARVTGIEIDKLKVAAAQTTLPADISFLEGRGEDLPLPDASQDLVCFIHSFHHVPVANHDKALAEARRVLKTGGRIHVAEPMAEGSIYQVTRLVDDETEIRKASLERMKELADEPGVRLVASRNYELRREYADFDAYLERAIFVDPSRKDRLPAVRDEMQRIFKKNCTREGSVCCLYQPCAAFHFQITN